MTFIASKPHILVVSCYVASVPFLPQRINIGERCVNSINHFLELIAKEVKTLLGALCDERTSLDDQVRRDASELSALLHFSPLLPLSPSHLSLSPPLHLSPSSSSPLFPLS